MDEDQYQITVFKADGLRRWRGRFLQVTVKAFTASGARRKAERVRAEWVSQKGE